MGNDPPESDDDETAPVLAPLCHLSERTVAQILAGEHPGEMTEEQLKIVRDEAMAAATGGWTTKVPPSVAAHYRWPGELHAVLFYHRSDPGTGERESVSIQYPEDSEEYARKMLKLAKTRKARVLVMANTAEQAEWVANILSRALPRHTRRSIEPFFVGKPS
jgi:hypothetical protein